MPSKNKVEETNIFEKIIIIKESREGQAKKKLQVSASPKKHPLYGRQHHALKTPELLLHRKLFKIFLATKTEQLKDDQTFAL